MVFSLASFPTASRARVGRLELAHATLETPAFMPCASLAVARALDSADLEAAGVQILCADSGSTG